MRSPANIPMQLAARVSALLARLTLKHVFVVSGIMFVAPIAVLFYFSVSDTLARVEHTDREVAALDLLVPLIRL